MPALSTPPRVPGPASRMCPVIPRACAWSFLARVPDASGGDDILAYYASRMTNGTQVNQLIAADLTIMLTELVELYPKIEVVIFG